jgi:subtilase family serine protease
MHLLKKLGLFSSICALAVPAGLAQTNRIAGRIDNSRTVRLQGRVHPQANAANDRGAVEPSFAVPGITLLLRSSAAQQGDLDQLLAQQQDPASPDFHQWLTPEQYADRFGATNDEVAQIVAWGQSQGLQVTTVARSRMFISFSATADQVQNAFHTQIHRYNVNGRTHFANATDPAIPAALSNIVAGVMGLNDFHLKPRLKKPSAPAISFGG